MQYQPTVTRTPPEAIHPDSLRDLGSIFQRPSLEAPKGGERIELPVDAYLQQIVEMVWQHQVVIVVGGTGTGKSTRIPDALLESGYDVLVTQPRRLAARAVAARVADERGEALGDTVGYRTALDGEDSPATKLLYCTDGLALVKQLASGSGRDRLLVLDEVHEFNANIEMLLAWLKHETSRNPNQKAVIMSATMDAERLSRYFKNAPIIEVPGRTHEIEVVKRGPSIEADAIHWASKGKNVLVFLPGKGEIARAMEEVERRGVDAELFELHADLLPEEQDRCFRQYERPKIIFATNVAQTSITIPDIDVVIDSGLERQMVFEGGVHKLKCIPISIADELQRMGRAGRTHKGYYISHCTAERGRRLAFPTPEIERTALDQVVLRFACQDLDIERLALFHQPPRPLVQSAKETLRLLGCFDQESRPTQLGERIANLPVSARVGRMLVEADKRGVLDDMVTAAVLLEHDGVKARDGETCYSNEDSDVLSEMEIFSEGCRLVATPGVAPHERKALLERAGIAPRAFEKVLESRHHLSDMCRKEFGVLTDEGSTRDLIASIVAGNLDRLFRAGESFEAFEHCGGGRGSAGRRLSRDSALTFERHDLPLVVAKPFDLQIEGKHGPMFLNLLVMATKAPLSVLREVAAEDLAIERLPAKNGRPQGQNPKAQVRLYFKNRPIWTGALSEEVCRTLPERRANDGGVR